MKKSKWKFVAELSVIALLCAGAAAIGIGIGAGGIGANPTSHKGVADLHSWTSQDQDDADSGSPKVTEPGTVIVLTDLDAALETLEREAGERWRAACGASGCDDAVTVAATPGR